MEKVTSIQNAKCQMPSNIKALKTQMLRKHLEITTNKNAKEQINLKACTTSSLCYCFVYTENNPADFAR